MNQPNNNSQTPPNPSSVPDHRLEEVMQKMKTLELQNQQLRGQIDYMAKQGQTQGQQQPQQPSPFKPEVQEAIAQLVNQKLEAERTGFRQQIGMLYDQLDAVNYTTKYSGEKFAKYHDKVERLRQQYQAQNQYVSREDALRMVYFEETGKKDVQTQPPQVQTPPPPKQPVFDSFFGTFVDPDTGKPIAPQAPTGEEPQEPPQQQWQQPTPPAQQQWAQAPQAPPPPAQQAGQFYPGQRVPQGQNHPNGNAYGQTFQLPNQGVNAPSAPTHQAAASARAPLSLESSDAELAAFENQFGDIPL